VEERLGAYALDALPEAEAGEVRAHLAQCPEQSATADQLRATARQLPALSDSVAAPRELRARVLSAIARESEAAPVAIAASGAGGRVTARPRSRITWAPRARNVRSYGWLAAAAVFVAAMGLLAWNLVLLNGDGDTTAQRFARTGVVRTVPSTSGGADATMVTFAGEDKAVILFGRKPLDASQAYQVWRVSDGGQMTSIGLTRGDASGRVAAVVPYDASRGEGVAVTIEPASGSPQPTTEPIFRT
jgi:anti-sigma-K factor RskA